MGYDIFRISGNSINHRIFHYHIDSYENISHNSNIE